MTATLPHHHVLTRLGVSAIDGIGVFAIAPIPMGAVLFPNDPAPLRWIDSAALEAEPLTSAQRDLYRDFTVERGGRLGCPESFDLLTPGWYLNEPRAGDMANVAAAEDLTLIAARDIAAGEELTIVYATFSERG